MHYIGAWGSQMTLRAMANHCCLCNYLRGYACVWSLQKPRAAREKALARLRKVFARSRYHIDAGQAC